eukprot:4256110-Pleurochrysis_carterae.AAC.1
MTWGDAFLELSDLVISCLLSAWCSAAINGRQHRWVKKRYLKQSRCHCSLKYLAEYSQRLCQSYVQKRSNKQQATGQRGTPPVHSSLSPIVNASPRPTLIVPCGAFCESATRQSDASTRRSYTRCTRYLRLEVDLGVRLGEHAHERVHQLHRAQRVARRQRRAPVGLQLEGVVVVLLAHGVDARKQRRRVVESKVFAAAAIAAVVATITVISRLKATGIAVTVITAVAATVAATAAATAAIAAVNVAVAALATQPECAKRMLLIDACSTHRHLIKRGQVADVVATDRVVGLVSAEANRRLARRRAKGHVHRWLHRRAEHGEAPLEALAGGQVRALGFDAGKRKRNSCSCICADALAKLLEAANLRRRCAEMAARTHVIPGSWIWRCGAKRCRWHASGRACGLA